MKSRWRAWFWQSLLLVGVLAMLAWLLGNTLENMRSRGIQSGWDFLGQPVGFEIGETLIAYSPEDPFWRAFWVGLLNTLRVAVLGIVATTALGLLVALARLSEHPIAQGFARVYVEVFRNIPLLLQLLMLYVLLVEWMPDVDAPWQWGEALFWSKAGLVWGVEPEAVFTLSPEFLALWGGLTLYTSAYVAEVFRAGLQAVPQGQWHGAMSLGLTRGQALRSVILPQAMRVAVPPLTSQYLNLTKNSSLAVAIGYPDLVSVANTTMNQTGRAVECVAILMLVYLSLSLITAWAMNRYNQRVMAHVH